MYPSNSFTKNIMSSSLSSSAAKLTSNLSNAGTANKNELAGDLQNQGTFALPHTRLIYFGKAGPMLIIDGNSSPPVIMKS